MSQNQVKKFVRLHGDDFFDAVKIYDNDGDSIFFISQEPKHLKTSNWETWGTKVDFGYTFNQELSKYDTFGSIKKSYVGISQEVFSAKSKFNLGLLGFVRFFRKGGIARDWQLSEEYSLHYLIALLSVRHSWAADLFHEKNPVFNLNRHCFQIGCTNNWNFEYKIKNPSLELVARYGEGVELCRRFCMSHKERGNYKKKPDDSMSNYELTSKVNF